MRNTLATQPAMNAPVDKTRPSSSMQPRLFRSLKKCLNLDIACTAALTFDAGLNIENLLRAPCKFQYSGPES